MIIRGLNIFANLGKNKLILNFRYTRNFSTKGFDNLKKALENEISYEETNYQNVSNEDTHKFLKDNDFTFSDKENTTQLELKKTVNNLNVYITFQAK